MSRPCKATSKQVTRLRQLHAQGMTVRTIAATLGLSKSAVQRLINKIRAGEALAPKRRSP